MRMARVVSFFQKLNSRRRTDRLRRLALYQAGNLDAEITFKYVAEYSSDVICRCRPDLVLTYVSPSSERVLGWAPEDMVGHCTTTFVLFEDRSLLAMAMVRLVAEPTESVTVTVRRLRRDGSIIWVETSLRMITDPRTGHASEAILVMRNVTDRKLLEEKLSAMALIDGLTGLANRRAFDAALEGEWRQMQMDQTELALLLLDLDNFKLYNDSYGHQMGDECLRIVAAVVKSAANRGNDVSARYGGEEFGVILPSTDAAGACNVAERIRGSVEALRLAHKGNPEGGGQVTVSIGLATASGRSNGAVMQPESLIFAADKALYQAKHRGRNRIANALVVPGEDNFPPTLSINKLRHGGG